MRRIGKPREARILELARRPPIHASNPDNCHTGRPSIWSLLRDSLLHRKTMEVVVSTLDAGAGYSDMLT